MKLRTALASLALCGVGVYALLAPRAVPADPRPVSRPPLPVVLLEGAPGGTHTRVVLRAPDTATQPRELGAFDHAEGSALRGTVDFRSPDARTWVVATEPNARRGSTYNSALWRFERGRAPQRMLGGLTDASRPLVTAHGDVVVQRGDDGDDPPTGDRVLRERVDALRLDVIDPDNGTPRTVWRGRGMIAFAAASMGGDEVLVYHVHPQGASLLAVDVRAQTARAVLAAMEPLARDFSYDAARDEVTFVRASARREGVWEVVTIPAHGASLDAMRTRWRAVNDHLMPRALRDGSVLISLPGDRGLAQLNAFPERPLRVAPLGDGADEALAESPDGAWIALRHRTADREVLGLYARDTERTITLDLAGTYVELAGFAPRAVTP